MMHFRLVNLKILREVIFAIKELLRDRLKGIVNAKKSVVAIYHIFQMVSMEQVLKLVDHQTLLCCRNQNEKLQQAFQLFKRKRQEVHFCKHNFKCNVQGYNFVYFYEVIKLPQSNYSPLYFILAPLSKQSDSSHCQPMESFKSKTSFKKKANLNNNLKVALPRTGLE